MAIWLCIINLLLWARNTNAATPAPNNVTTPQPDSPLDPHIPQVKMQCDDRNTKCSTSLFGWFQRYGVCTNGHVTRDLAEHGYCSVMLPDQPKAMQASNDKWLWACILTFIPLLASCGCACCCGKRGMSRAKRNDERRYERAGWSREYSAGFSNFDYEDRTEDFYQ